MLGHTCMTLEARVSTQTVLFHFLVILQPVFFPGPVCIIISIGSQSIHPIILQWSPSHTKVQMLQQSLLVLLCIHVEGQNFDIAVSDRLISRPTTWLS